MSRNHPLAARKRLSLLLDDSMFPSTNLVAIDVVERGEIYTNYLVTPVDKRELRFVRSFVEVACEVLQIQPGTAAVGS